MNDNIELQDEIIKSDIKKVEKLWKNNIEDNNLSYLLDKMTKDELVKVAKKYSVRGITTLKKAEAVEILSGVILNNTEKVLELTDENGIDFLRRIMSQNGRKKYQCTDLIYSNFFRNRGVLFTGIIEEELSVIMPQELKVSLENLINKDVINNSKLNSDIIKVISGIVYFYGVVSLEKIQQEINRIFGDIYDFEKIKEFILVGEELGYDYIIEEDKLCHIDVEDAECIIKLQKEQSCDFNRFDKKSLIKAGSPDYIETNKQGEKLQKVIGNLFVIDKEILKEEVESFIMAIKNEMDRNEAIEIFLQAYEIESKEEKDIFVEELNLFAKSIKKWSLKGYTEDELEKNESRIINDIKIGRNDPCLCESGKKFKKCCGK